MSTFEDFSPEMLNSTAILFADKFGHSLANLRHAEADLEGITEVLSLITAERVRREAWHMATDCNGKHVDHSLSDMPPAPVGWKVGDPIPKADA